MIEIYLFSRYDAKILLTMSGDDNDVQEVVVRFVIPRGKSEVTVSDALSNAYDQSSEAGLGPNWVKEEDILSITPTKTVSINYFKIPYSIEDL